MSAERHVFDVLQRYISNTREYAVDIRKLAYRSGAALRTRTLTILILTAACGAHVALAQAPQSDGGNAPPTTQPEVQAEAVKALDAMGAYLRTLNRFRVDADSVTDAVLTTGQNVGFLHRTEMSVQRPDKIRIVVTGSRSPKGLVYDGRSVVLFDDAHRYYSKVPAPPTIRQLIADIDEKYGVQLPLVDLFYWGQDSDDEKALSSALFIGLDRVGGKWCRHYVYQQPDLDWELWIESGSRPLPCRFVVTDTTQPSRPQHAVNYHWTLNPSFSADTFRFSPASGARQIPLRAPGSAADASQGDAP
nr:hypothetical protein HUO10_002120 [Paraburkholderia busanensis]